MDYSPLSHRVGHNRVTFTFTGSGQAGLGGGVGFH